MFAHRWMKIVNIYKWGRSTSCTWRCSFKARSSFGVQCVLEDVRANSSAKISIVCPKKRCRRSDFIRVEVDAFHFFFSITMINLLGALVLFSICSAKGQIVFPEDPPLVADREAQEITKNLSTLSRGSAEYEHYVDTLIANGIAKLTLSVDKVLMTSTSLENVVYAPVSIAGAMALVLLGANGKTFDEIAAVMGLAVGVDIHSKSQLVHQNLGRLFGKLDATDLSEQIKIAAAIFVQDDFPIRSLYKDSSEKIYNSEILNLDFKGDGVNAQRVINAWVSDRTNAKITNIVSEAPPPSTRVIIASALYFKGAWEKPFFDGFTRRRKFFPNGRKSSSSIQVEMMSNGGSFPYYKDTALDCEIMGFPYKGNKTTMYVIMPTASDTQRLKELRNRLSPGDVHRLADSTKYAHSVVLFPKMKLESSIDLSVALQTLGVKSLFNPEEANLALLSPGTRGEHVPNVHDNLSNVINPIVAAAPNSARELNRNSVLIFSRTGETRNCTHIFDPTSNMTKCEALDENTNKHVIYKKFGDKVGRRVTRQAAADNLDSLRSILNSDPSNKNVENPGLYADKVLHKVYMDITESGTEAAAATFVSLSRGGDIITFRVDVPFLFFIRHEETKLILFWGAVTVPTPSFS